MQYIQPQHHARLSAAELLVIDEAAAIPLPLVKAMLGPYLVFLCSTVNGYEGRLPQHVLLPCTMLYTCRAGALLFVATPKIMQFGFCPTSSSFMNLRVLATGTGRSLSLKLLQQLREEGSKLSSGGGDGANAAGGGRTFREIVLQEPIRWAAERLPLIVHARLQFKPGMGAWGVPPHACA